MIVDTVRSRFPSSEAGRTALKAQPLFHELTPAHDRNWASLIDSNPVARIVEFSHAANIGSQRSRLHSMMPTRCPSFIVGWCMLIVSSIHCGPSETETVAWPDGTWLRHTIDDSSLGADGVRLGDLDGDGLLDIASPWEQGGLVRVYLNPGADGLRDRWPAVTVGEVGDPEDAFFADLDGDGKFEVVSSCEGETRSIYVHWAPADPGELLDPGAWTTEQLPQSAGEMAWMFAAVAQVDGRLGADLIAGGKGEGAEIGWFEAPESPRRLAEWTWRSLYKAGWIMTIRPHDMDGDRDLDIVATDRMGQRRGTLWLENPGPDQAGSSKWDERRIGPVNDHEAMHNAIADLDADGLDDVLVAVKGEALRFHRRTGSGPIAWETYRIAMPPHTGSGKSIDAADIDLDGQIDLVVACEHATDGKIGVFWMSHSGDPTASRWQATSISGPEGFIYDLVQLVDLDQDGDLDVLTLEEKGPYFAQGYQGRELGVIWYENPTSNPST